LVVALLSAFLYLVVCFVSSEKRGGGLFEVIRCVPFPDARRGTSGGLRERRRQIASSVAIVAVAAVVFAAVARSSLWTAAATEQPQCLE
jgi:hypothetical protein